MVWENVPGAFTSNGGEDFRVVLEETARVADETAAIPKPPHNKWSYSGAIVGDGWSIAWRVHDAQFWGVPQRRKRIALVADFGGQSAPEILFERKGLSGHSAESRKEGQGITTDIERGVDKAGEDVLILENHAQDCRCKICEDGVVPTLNKQMGTGGNNVPMVMRRNASTARCTGINGDLAGTLDANYYKGCGERQGVERDVVCVSQPHDAKIAISFQERAGKPGGGKGILIQEEKTGALSTLSNQAVCCEDNRGSDWQYTVRRLTPLECERLQGYPDHWTNIGEWTDSKGKKHKDADSPRYKALGNSIALPFWKWMAKRMVAQLKESGVSDPTMASLFDGISGFCLCFSEAGCKPVWSSEVDGFCIAVAKIRFPEDDKEVEE